MKKKTSRIAEKLSNGLSEANQKEVVEILSTVLSDQHILYIKLRNFHWNLKGSRFNSLHALFERQYEALALAIDETAERIRMLGGIAPASMSEFLSGARLKEVSASIIEGEKAIEALVKDHEAVIRSLRKDADTVEESCSDSATADFLIALIQKHEQDAWMLRSSKE